jgi:hypothetical protein
VEEIADTLRAKNIFDDKVARELAALWKYGVLKVSDSGLRRALIYFLQTEAPWTFFVYGASATGKNHPSWQREKAGILRNTTECCLVVDRQLRVYPEFTDEKFNVLPEHRDIVLIATILSDTFKAGSGEGDEEQRRIQGSDPTHGAAAAQRWNDVARRFQIESHVRDSVYDAIYWHLGRFTPGWNRDVRFSAYTEITHRIDMFMSDKNLEILFDPKNIIS